MSATQPPAVISISSHVVRGSVGNRAAIFALETLGFPAWSLPTVILPYHPGHGRATRIETDAGEFDKLLCDLLASSWIGEVKAVMTGYMANTGQVAATARFLRALTARFPDLVYLCDPVIGDRNGLYVRDDIAAAIRDKLMPLATVTTPNIHELAWMIDTGVTDSIEQIRQAALTLAGSMRAPKESIIVATSVPGMMRGNIANLLVCGPKIILAENRMLAGPGNGAGDLFSTVYLAALLNGNAPEKALERATSSVFEVMADAVKRGDSELLPQLAGASIARPMAMVTMRALAVPGGSSSAVPHRVDAAARRQLVGVDGCKAGWIAVSCTADAGEPIRPEVAVFTDFRSLVDAFPAESIIAVDMPMGLPERINGSGRDAEKAVRPLLAGRQSSVFSIPSRAAVEAADYGEACGIALATSDPPRKVSRQAFHLFPKIRQIDEILRERGQRGIFESHPEVAFWRLNRRRPVSSPKKIRGRLNQAGLDDRRHLLIASGLDEEFLTCKPPRGAALDDVLDASACLTVARRIATGEAEAFPPDELRDAHGLRIAIWA